MKNELVILTGPSGSGITSARFVFEELGYAVCEGAPIESIPAILDAYKQKQYKKDKFCLIVPIQNARSTYEIVKKEDYFETKLILLTTQKDEILKRYALTRHTHPRSVNEKVVLDKAIDLDIKDEKELRPDADIAIDSTCLATKELRRQLYHFLTNESVDKHLTITFMSFGIKNGIPDGIDMFFDVRALPNPYWVESLKELTGKDKEVIDYLNSFPETKEFLDHLVAYLDLHISNLKKTDRVSYVIGIACSGGQHRSTFVAEYLAKHYSGIVNTIATHRDTPAIND